MSQPSRLDFQSPSPKRSALKPLNFANRLNNAGGELYVNGVFDSSSGAENAVFFPASKGQDAMASASALASVASAGLQHAQSAVAEAAVDVEREQGIYTTIETDRTTALDEIDDMRQRLATATSDLEQAQSRAEVADTKATITRAAAGAARAECNMAKKEPATPGGGPTDKMVAAHTLAAESAETRQGLTSLTTVPLSALDEHF